MIKYREKPFEEEQVRSLKDVGKIIRLIRKESGLTQQRSAMLCGVTSKFLSQLESGKEKHFSLLLTLQVIQFFGLQINIKKRKIQ